MAQFDVYRNPSEATLKDIPFVVVVQSDLLDTLATRMTIPLCTLEFAAQVPEKLCPRVSVNDQKLRALAHYAGALPTRSLRQKVANLTADASALVAALDVVISGI